MNTVTKMNQFRIECSEINYFTILVEAETEDEARDLAHKDINSFEVETEEEALALYNRGHYLDSNYNIDDMFYDYQFNSIREETDENN